MYGNICKNFLLEFMKPIAYDEWTNLLSRNNLKWKANLSRHLNLKSIKNKPENPS